MYKFCMEPTFDNYKLIKLEIRLVLDKISQYCIENNKGNLDLAHNIISYSYEIRRDIEAANKAIDLLMLLEGSTKSELKKPVNYINPTDMILYNQTKFEYPILIFTLNNNAKKHNANFFVVFDKDPSMVGSFLLYRYSTVEGMYNTDIVEYDTIMEYISNICQDNIISNIDILTDNKNCTKPEPVYDRSIGYVYDDRKCYRCVINKRIRPKISKECSDLIDKNKCQTKFKHQPIPWQEVKPTKNIKFMSSAFDFTFAKP